MDPNLSWESDIPISQRGSVAILDRLLSNNAYPNRSQFFKVILDGQNEPLKRNLINKVDQFSDLEKQVVIVAIESNGKTEYELDIISLLEDDNERVRQRAIETLGKIGSKKSYPSLYAFFQKTPKDRVLRSALSRLAYPGLNQKLVQTIIDPNTDLSNRIFSTNLLALRDLTGNIDLINKMGQKSSAPPKLQKSLIAIMANGNLKSAEILLSLILKVKDSQTNLKDVLFALKNLSTKLPVDDQFWKTHLEPVLLKEDYHSETKKNIIRILDPKMDPNVFAHVNQQVISKKISPDIRSAYLGNLMRWRSINTGWIWLDILKNSSVKPTAKNTAKQKIIQLLSLRTNNRKEATTKADLIRETLPELSNDQDKIAILDFLNSDKDPHIITIRKLLSADLKKTLSNATGVLKEVLIEIVNK